MATTKETMKIIAMGLGETGTREPENCADCPLVDAQARRAAEHITEMTEEMDEEMVLEIVRKLETKACYAIHEYILHGFRLASQLKLYIFIFTFKTADIRG